MSKSCGKHNLSDAIDAKMRAKLPRRRRIVGYEKGRGDTLGGIICPQLLRLADDRKDAQLQREIKSNALRRQIEKMRPNAEVVVVRGLVVRLQRSL